MIMAGPLELIILAVLLALFVGWIVALVAAVRSKSTGLAIAVGVVPVFGCLLLGAFGALFFVAAAPMPAPAPMAGPTPVPQAVVVDVDRVPVDPAAASEALASTARQLGLELTAGGATVEDDGTCTLEVRGPAELFESWIAELEAWENPPLELLEFSQVPLEDGRARMRVVVRARR